MASSNFQPYTGIDTSSAAWIAQHNFMLQETTRGIYGGPGSPTVTGSQLYNAYNSDPLAYSQLVRLQNAQELYARGGGPRTASQGVNLYNSGPSDAQRQAQADGGVAQPSGGVNNAGVNSAWLTNGAYDPIAAAREQAIAAAARTKSDNEAAYNAEQIRAAGQAGQAREQAASALRAALEYQNQSARDAETNRIRIAKDQAIYDAQQAEVKAIQDALAKENKDREYRGAVALSLNAQAETRAMYVTLAKAEEEGVARGLAALKAGGLTPAQIASVTADNKERSTRLARAQAELQANNAQISYLATQATAPYYTPAAKAAIAAIAAEKAQQTKNEAQKAREAQQRMAQEAEVQSSAQKAQANAEANLKYPSTQMQRSAVANLDPEYYRIYAINYGSKAAEDLKAATIIANQRMATALAEGAQRAKEASEATVRAQQAVAALQPVAMASAQSAAVTAKKVATGKKVAAAGAGVKAVVKKSEQSRGIKPLASVQPMRRANPRTVIGRVRDSGGLRR